jgi:hypothetical protein
MSLSHIQSHLNTDLEASLITRTKISLHARFDGIAMRSILRQVSLCINATSYRVVDINNNNNRNRGDILKTCQTGTISCTTNSSTAAANIVDIIPATFTVTLGLRSHSATGSTRFGEVSATGALERMDTTVYPITHVLAIDRPHYRNHKSELGSLHILCPLAQRFLTGRLHSLYVGASMQGGSALVWPRNCIQ